MFKRQPGLLAGLVILVAMTGPGSARSETDPASDTRVPVLTPVEEYGDFMSSGRDSLFSELQGEKAGGYKKIYFAAAVAARGNDIFVADTSQRRIFHIDRAQRSINVFATIQGGMNSDVYVSDDLSVYYIDQLQREVIQYSLDGQLLAKFADNIYLSMPVAVVESTELNRILVADGFDSHIAVFNRLGGLSGSIGQTIKVPFLSGSIGAMVSHRDWIYLLDKTAREVSVIDIEGNNLYRAGSEYLKQPVALAIDYCQRLYVADQYDNSLHVFYVDEYLAGIENGRGFYRLEQLTDIWIDNELLYMADGASGSIKVMRIEGDCV